MKRIGFIDHYIDEWHANHFPEWIRNSPWSGEFELVAAWAPQVLPGRRSTAEWCRDFGIKEASSVQELIDQSDCLFVLAPDHPEFHEELALPALASGKPTFIDKPFAPNLTAAFRMMEAAHKNGTPVLSSSALRFAAECRELQVKATTLTPRWLLSIGGNNLNLYGVHQVEMLITIFGKEARQVQCVGGTPEAPLLVIDFGDEQKASLQVFHAAPFRISALFSDGSVHHTLPFNPEFFQELINAVLQFFATRETPFEPWQTLAVIALLDAARAAVASPGTTIAVAPVKQTSVL